MVTPLPDQPLTSLGQLYEQDYFRWLEETAHLLRSGHLEKLDVGNLADEIEDMGRNEKRAVESNLEIVLMHLLKWQYQPERRSNSWQLTIFEHRKRLAKLFRDSPSLRNYYAQVFGECYQNARKMAAIETGLPLETFSPDPPFDEEEVLNSDYLP
jgi:hypothetical protein